MLSLNHLSAIVVLVFQLWTAQASPITVQAEWGDRFTAQFCLSSSKPIYPPWTIKLKFNQPISSIQIYGDRAKHRNSSADKTELFLVNHKLSQPWKKGETNCIGFMGVKESGALGALSGTAEFVELDDVKECVRQETGQNLELEIAESWSQGFKVKFCLDAPKDMNKIILDFQDTMPFDKLEIWSADAKTVDNQVWTLTPKAWKKVVAGERFCLEFIARTQGYMNPCIDAYFGVGKINKPVKPKFTATSATATTYEAFTTYEAPTVT